MRVNVYIASKDGFLHSGGSVQTGCRKSVFSPHNRRSLLWATGLRQRLKIQYKQSWYRVCWVVAEGRPATLGIHLVCDAVEDPLTRTKVKSRAYFIVFQIVKSKQLIFWTLYIEGLVKPVGEARVKET